MRCLLIGNYGVGNVGDEALKEYFLQQFPEVEWVVLSAAKEYAETPRLLCGLRSLFLTPWWRTVRAYARCDGVVCGGGSLFTDVESRYAPILWAWHAAFAVLFRKRIFLAFQGIGPFRTRMGEWCARWVVRRATFLSVRDRLSFARVERWNVNTKCILSFDPVLSLVKNSDIPQSLLNSQEHYDHSRSKIVLIIPRKNSSKEFWGRAEAMRGQGFGEVRVLEPTTLIELCQTMSGVSFLLTQRYHAGLVALALGVPFEAVPQAPGDKLDALHQEDRDCATLHERVRVGEEALRSALYSLPLGGRVRERGASSPRGRGLR